MECSFLGGYIYFVILLINFHIIYFTIVMWQSDYRRGLDWWYDLLTAYPLKTRYYALQITATHRVVSSVY
jgi:hypothetical protein